MDENCKVPVPINFNCWKHHAGFICKQISICRKQEELETLKKILLKIGNSQMDLYFGSLSPFFISESIIKFLRSLDVLSKNNYGNWLKAEGNDYRLFRLTDNSIWTLRFGVAHARYVHIHPGRKSPNTIRVRALTLRTAIFVLGLGKINKNKQINVEIINTLRKKYLIGPPLKKFSYDSGLGKILNLLDKQI